MTKELVLQRSDRRAGSYYRKDFIGDVLYYCFIYRDVHITFAKKGRKSTIISDTTAELLETRGLISKEKHYEYKKKISSLFSLETLKNFDDYSIEEIYRFVTDIREEIFGVNTFIKLWEIFSEESRPLSFDNCTDQRDLIEKYCADKNTIFVAITEPNLFATMKQVLSTSVYQNKKIVYITSANAEYGLPSPPLLTSLLKEPEINTVSLENGKLVSERNDYNIKQCSLLIFGESGLLDARKLQIPCGIFCIPKGYHACAVAGQLGIVREAAIFVPSGFSIVENVPITKKTRLSYLILAKLAKKYGDQIYSLSTKELYNRYPHCFFNIYETDPNAPLDENLSLNDLPNEKITLEQYDFLRARAIKEHLESFSNCRYFHKTFTESETEGIKGKILVHGVCIKNSDGAGVLPCGKKTSLREKIRQEKQDGTGIVSNFLFFLTPKLATLYNTLRQDRIDEMSEVDAGHLDYLLEYRNGKRIETFPLFRKTCIALKENGEFLFFNFRLGGGQLSINGNTLSWDKENVDPKDDKPQAPVCIYTPYISLSDEDADRETYRKAVGKERVNFVLIQERITAIRDGDVLLPGMGVVISLEKELGEKLCNSLGLIKNERGYYETKSVSVQVKLDAPEGVDSKEWNGVKWAYGGGLSLILDGIGLCDGDHMDKWFYEDGWTSPLSRQTQESALHTLAKHPRTAIGITKSGELIILVFSGRTSDSDGADYSEMCLIARTLIPDMQFLMNVDGGGSAMLGMVQNGSFTELSLPSTSTGSTVGMVRPINTVLYVPLKQ